MLLRKRQYLENGCSLQPSFEDSERFKEDELARQQIKEMENKMAAQQKTDVNSQFDDDEEEKIDPVELQKRKRIENAERRREEWIQYQV